MDSHALWAYAHVLLFVYWLGADVGLWLAMAMIRNPALSYETRATLVRLGFYVDLFPRVTFALILPVGMHLMRDLDLAPIGDGLLAAAWTVGFLWSALHLGVLAWKGRPVVAKLRAINKVYEALAGLLFVVLGAVSLARGAPVEGRWLALKLLFFGMIFWVILGFDTVFQPFSTLLRAGPAGMTPQQEAGMRRLTNLSMAWAVMLYVLIAAVAFLGLVKPFW
jgi:hypothetical protein